MGGEITFYRQFVLTSDYELFVASDVEFLEPRIPYLRIQPSRWLERLKRTRLAIWAHDYSNLIEGTLVRDSVLRAARYFRPDVVYTVAGSFWHARMAKSLARRLNVPLAAHFMDWSTFNFVGHPWARRMADQQFRSFYRRCDLAFCICEGMKQELGLHPNAPVHYPIGADPEKLPEPTEPPVPGRFRVTFAGNLGEWYGEMLQKLVTVLPGNSGIDLRIYGKFHRWPAEFEKQIVARGIYRGFLPFSRLANELANTDALFLLMGFDPGAKLIESTSFKTKFLEYLPFRKPILVWGPHYSTAVRLAQQHDAALTCCSEDPQAALKALHVLREDLSLQARLVLNATRMFEKLFHPRKTKSAALEKFRATIKLHRDRKQNGVTRGSAQAEAA